MKTKAVIIPTRCALLADTRPVYPEESGEELLRNALAQLPEGDKLSDLLTQVILLNLLLQDGEPAAIQQARSRISLLLGELGGEVWRAQS